MKIISIWFHQKSWSYPQSGFSNEFISQIHMSHIIDSKGISSRIRER